MRIVTVAGARPQFIKAAAMSRALREEHDEIFVHTGQHYDENMSESFFRELQIPSPAYCLGVGSATHGVQTAIMLDGVEKILQLEKPDAVLVYGDTNSTLAGALAAVKLGVPVMHVEAGLRSFDMRMPEEINRVITDRVSSLLLCPGEVAVTNLLNEGISSGVHAIGDVMLDALIEAAGRSDEGVSVWGESVVPDTYAIATIHRAENTDDPARLSGIVRALGEVPYPVLFPVHPRTRNALKRGGISLPANVHAVEPLSYVAMARALGGAHIVLTDSGGLQKEAYWLRVPCITLRDSTEWVETVSSGWNQLAGADQGRIAAALAHVARPQEQKPCYGEPGAVARAVALITEFGKSLS